MKKHRIAYIDEQTSEIRKFQRRVEKAFDVLPFQPKQDMLSFVEELLHSEAEAFVADYRLNEYKDPKHEVVNYTGAELIEEILKHRQGFPCFVLTSYDDDAVQAMQDVNYVYPKGMLNPESHFGKVSFVEKVRVQIEHYQHEIANKSEEFYSLLEKSELQDLTDDEENRLLKLDSFLESSLDDHISLPSEKKSQLAVGRIDELISTTSEILKVLRNRK